MLLETIINNKDTQEVIAIYGLIRKTFKVGKQFDTFEKCQIAASFWLNQLKEQIRIENSIKTVYGSSENRDEVLRNQIWLINNKIN